MRLSEALKSLNIPTAKFEVASSVAEVERSAKKFGFPVVLKTDSSRISHKTEVGGVQVAHNIDELRTASAELLKLGNIVVQEKCEGVELFLGIKNDPSFGHVLLAGMGGIFVEVYKDVSFRVCPIEKKDAERMLDELKGKKILEGIRGMKPVNRKALIDAMVTLSQLPRKLDMEELDVNPLFANSKEVVAVDCRIVLK